MFTTTGPPLGQFSAGAMAAALGPQAGPLVGAFVIMAAAAGMAAFAGSVRRFAIAEEVEATGRAHAQPQNARQRPRAHGR
jgi:hypothetical protein